MPLLTEEEQLQAYFEKVTSENWGWNNFSKNSKNRYTSTIVYYCWLTFKHGVEIGKELQKIKNV